MKKNMVLFVLLFLAVLISGCTAPTGTGDLVLQITDQPNLDIEKADVTISKVQVHVAGAGNESGWITVMEEFRTFDLVAIKEVKAYLGGKELVVGTYAQIRLDVDKALVTINGTVHNLTIPSKTVKLVRSFDIEENKTTTLTLDFDAELSIHSAGASGNYIMRPTIMVIQE